MGVPLIEQVAKMELMQKLHGIEGVFASGIMQDIQRSWTLKSIKEGKLGVCAMKCGTELIVCGTI